MFERFDRHVRLMNRMGDALGRDLEGELLSGELSPEAYREKVYRCVGCSNPEACQKLLDSVNGVLDGPPEYCRNRSDFDLVTK